MQQSETLPPITTTTLDHGWIWLRDGYRLYMQSPINWLVMCVMFIVGLLIFSFIPLLSLLVQITVPGITAGLILAAHTLQGGVRINPGYLLAGFRRNLNELLLLGVISLIANTLIMILTSLLLGLFTNTSIIEITNHLQSGVVPDEKMLNDLFYLAILLATLTLPLIMALWFSPALIVLNDMKAWNAFKLSFKACHHNIIPFIAYGLISVGFIILATLPFGLGLMILTPVILIALTPALFCSMYCSWRDVFGDHKTDTKTE